MFMSSAVKCLFCGEGKPFNKDVQNRAFGTVYSMGQEGMELQGRLSLDEQAEESANRTASLLATLSTVARCSPACEKKTVFALMQAIRLNGIEVSLMRKVLQSISESLYYTSVTVFVESHLGYLIHQWLSEKYLLPEFPHQLLACPTEVDFYRKYHGAVIPHLVTMQSLGTIRDIAQSLDTDLIQLLKDSFPQSIAHILPQFGHTRAAEEEVESVDYQERRSRAMLCFEALENTLGKDTINCMIQCHLDSIVVELLAMLYERHADDNDVAQFTSDIDPEPNPPFFNTYTIKATLDYLTKCHGSSKTLTLVSLLAKTQDSIQKILLALHIRISKSHRSHEKHRMVLAYRLFASLLLAELPSGLGGSWAMVLQDVIYTLVHTIQEGVETQEGEGLRLARPCIDLLHAVCETGLEHCHEELGKHLHVIMGAVVPLVEKKDPVANQALSLVNLLVIDNSKRLFGALRYLDPLPDSPKLARAKTAQRSSKYADGEFTLMEEVIHFLMLGNQPGGILRVEGLKHLHHQLATRKDELSIMVQQCAEGSDRTVIQLITELVDLSRTEDGHVNSSDGMSQALIEEAARCLGDIGAPNLSTVVLHCEETEKNASYSTALKVFAKDPIMSRHVIIIHLLKEYLTDPNVDTVEAAANCLKTVLATTSGQRCHEMYKERNIDKLFCYVHPFRPSKKKTTNKQAPHCSDASFAQTIDDPSLWQPVGGNHSNWVRNLTKALIQSGGMRDEILLLLEPICKVKVEFAEKVLPYLFHDMLSTGNDLYKRVLSHRVEAVFAGHCDSAGNSRATTPTPFADVSSSQLGQRSIRTLLDVMHYLRTQERPTQSRTKSTAWDNNFWLDVNYLLVAKAAQNCRAHFTCLLYTEIWWDVQRSRQGSSAGHGSGSESLSQHSDIETLSSLSNESNINIQSLLLEAYSSIGEPDGVYGCGAGRLTDTYARIHTYEHEGDWSKALSAYDLKLHSKSTQTGRQEVGVMQAMQNLGLSHILTVYLQGLRSEDVAFGPEMVQFQYEVAWRNTLWDLELDDMNQTSCHGYHQSLYTALSCLRDGESESFTVALQRARLETVQQLCHVSIESAYSVYPMLSRLQGLFEMENFGFMLLHNQPPNSVLQSWSSQLALMDNDFEFAEPTLALRTVLLQLLLEKSDKNNHLVAYEGLVGHLKKQTEMARKAGSFQIAEKALATLQGLARPAGVKTDHSWWRLIEEAKVYWTRSEKTTAMHLMKALLDKINRVCMEDPIAEALHPEVLTIYGNWLAETNSDSPNVIIEQYLDRAVEMYELMDDTSSPAIEAQLSLARFADSQYQNIVNYMKSSEYEDKQALMKQAKKDYEALLAMGDRVSRYARTLEKQSAIDERELGSMMEDKETFLHKAIECYLKCLEFGSPEHDMRVFRVCSLWFDNSSEEEINQLIQESFQRIESRKLLPLLYQLAARMTTKTQDKQLFHDVLNELIERTARDHPHHALPIILALANANKDAVIASRKTGRLARTNSLRDIDTSHADEARMQVAQQMLTRLKSTHCAEIIAGLEKLSDAYIELAYWDVSDRKKETGPINLPSNQPLTQLKMLKHVAMPTMEIPVDASCRYDNIVCIDHFDRIFKLAGGVNLPKIITCVGSDGIKRRQLVKGKDDLRQDAVMQQVFSLVNRLLQRNQETRKRRLQIRTYKIVPLSQRSGLLEWCEGTVPIGEYLIGNQKTDFGAHRRYRPHDYTSMECRKKMAMAHSSGEQGKKYREFLDVMKKFQPVFRHFFLEKFPDSAVWLERRLAYTRSVATSSIVGYVVGLGDRHVQNILIDCNLAELVHIDLGVAFEQGRILPTPETVPFRLTRDLVDGMGIAGVEGVFRRCCEKTMDVMHNSQEALLTILQVLLYDPLYIWTMSPHKAMALQQRRDRTDPDASELNATATDLPDGETGFKGQDSSDGTEVNKVAERVVLRLRQKLQGVEEGVAMSVKGQVNRLIQEARDPKNLCRLFPGWQPWV